MVDRESAVQRALSPFVESWSEYVLLVGSESERHGGLPTASSIAMSELSLEHRWSRPGWDEPVRNAHSYGSALIGWLADHLSAIGAVAGHAPFGPAYAHLTLFRSMMEGSVVAAWLLEPGIGAEARVKRSLAYRLDSANNLGRMSLVDGAIKSATMAKDNTVELANSLGWAVRKGSRPAVDDQQIPEAKSEFSRLVLGRKNPPLDQVWWNYSSAGAHGTFYAVRQSLVAVPGVTSPMDPGGSVRALLTSSTRIAFFGSLGFLGLMAGARARQDLMGWTSDSAMAAVEARLRALSMEALTAFATEADR